MNTAYDGSMAATLVQKPETPMLDSTHRCDRCGSQAYVAASHPDWESDLLFCAHHGRDNLPALLAMEGVWVHDETEKLISMEAAV